MLDLLGELGAELRWSSDQRLSLEVALTRMARPQGEMTLEALAERVEALERGALLVVPARRPLRSGSSPTAPSRRASRSRRNLRGCRRLRSAATGGRLALRDSAPGRSRHRRRPTAEPAPSSRPQPLRTRSAAPSSSSCTTRAG